ARALALTAALVALAPRPAHAGGFVVPEVGARRTGMGAVVGRPDEACAIYHNPAGMTLLPGTHVYLSLGFFFPTSSMQLRPFNGSPLYIRQPVDTQGYYPETVPTRLFGLVPMLAATTNLINDKLWLGLAFYVPNA